MSFFEDRALGLLMQLAIVTAEHPIVVVAAALFALFTACAVYKSVLRIEAWTVRRLDERRACRDAAAMWAEIDRILADALPLPVRPVSRQIKRRRSRVRIPRRRSVRRKSTSNSERH